MIQEVHITKVYRSTKKKDGTPLVGKNGKPYERVAIQTNEYGTRWLSGFGSHQTDTIAEGQLVQINVEEVGEYLNFSVPSKTDLLEIRVKSLENKVFGSNIPAQENSESEINIEDIPF